MAKKQEVLPEEGGESRLPPHLQELIDLLPLNVPVRQNEVFEKYGRKPEYARRIRKIVAEYGWEIERVRGKQGANDDYYIRRSEGPVRPRRIRYEVKPERRRLIYARDGWICMMCGADVFAEQKTTLPQCDHKVPSDRGGKSVDENLQTLCTRCNLKKRQACGLCTLTSCEGCPYAYPERFAESLTIQLTTIASSKLAVAAKREGIPPAVIVSRLLESMQ